MKIADIEMLVSILKYIDIEYMTDDEADSICDVDINNKNEQREVIRKLIVPGIKIQYSKEAFERTKDLIKFSIKNSKKTNKVFEGMSFPFEDEIGDKNDFLKTIYEELFGEKLIVEE